MNNEINRRVAHYRKMCNFTQEEAASALGLKTSTYSQKERLGNITATDIIRFAKTFGVEPEVLLLGEEAVTAKKLAIVAEASKNEVIKETNEKTTTKYEPAEIVLTAQEKNFVTMLRSLTKKKRENVLQYTYDVFKNKIQI